MPEDDNLNRILIDFLQGIEENRSAIPKQLLRVKGKKQLADEYGISVKLLGRRLRENGIETGYNKTLSPKELEIFYQRFGCPPEPIKTKEK